MRVDTSELWAFATELSRVAPEVARAVPAVVKKGANNVKSSMQADFRESRSFGHIARTVTYDTTVDATGVEAEIGPDKSRGGGASLAHIAYWGGANGGGGTVPDPLETLAVEVPQFEAALGKLIEGIL